MRFAQAFIVSAITSCLVSCNNDNSVQDATHALTDSTGLPPDSTSGLMPAEGFPDLSYLPVMNFPFAVDNGSYETPDTSKAMALTRSQFETMGLSALEDFCEFDDGCLFYVLDRVPFSDNFSSWLIYRNSGAEWIMWLVNYNSQNQVIDHLNILYGDAVEMMHETISEVTASEVQVTEITYDYSGEGPTAGSESRVNVYRIDETGHFIKTDPAAASPGETAGY
jgi:hypothetical protein